MCQQLEKPRVDVSVCEQSGCVSEPSLANIKLAYMLSSIRGLGTKYQNDHKSCTETGEIRVSARSCRSRAEGILEPGVDYR